MNIAIILSGGSGIRFNEGKGLPKQFYLIENKEVLYYALNTFNQNKNIDGILVVSNEEYISKTKELISKYNFFKVIDVINGGTSRQESSFNAIKYLYQKETYRNSNVLIHDAARLLVSEQIIEKNLLALKNNNAVTTVLKATDTIIEGEKNYLNLTLDRNKIYLVQTPQSFKLETIYNAHLNAKDNSFSDDASLMKLINEKVYLVEGEKSNIKLTTKEDLELISYYLSKRK